LKNWRDSAVECLRFIIVDDGVWEDMASLTAWKRIPFYCVLGDVILNDV